jgi:ribosomal protein S18 acetylase RimI-like enzyme
VATIRAATLQDLPGTYRVALLTGDAGRDASGLFRNPELLGHLYVGPYVVGRPDLASVIADEDGVAGYGLAAADTRAFEAWMAARWWPALRDQYPPRSDGSPDAELVALIHEPELPTDEVLADYPSHLHIDLLERVRGQGNGRLLIERMLAQLREHGSRGVHLGVAANNANAIAFYRHLGFEEVGQEPGELTMGRRL